LKTFEQFTHDEIDPYGEEEWNKVEFSIGEHTVTITRDYSFKFYKGKWGTDEDGFETWLEDELFELESKEGDELVVDVVDIDPYDHTVSISYDDETGYRGIALVPDEILSIKE
jgi:hypothetical protein